MLGLEPGQADHKEQEWLALNWRESAILAEPVWSGFAELNWLALDGRELRAFAEPVLLVER